LKPENQNNFLKFRALNTYKEFADLPFHAVSHLPSALEAICQGLFHEDLAIKVMAALCLKEFLYKPEVTDFIKPELEKILV